ncbi:branched-chain amino acid ABC transporter [Bacillus sp. FJAT-27264]|uniref:AzlD domain-containing protein n=1 Tax=Paenibacillus sp. (strain DSM 101736 / FJAT-27264) TaxID=1850362 RepID=UPI0008080910|nr:AzlD domain-containing protein [Bacillus sp. FJAT-27264]OBZ19197.1 branched-chain amino acid ABC transporter [Bacillus sp. FJAT-27264]
MEIRWDVFIIIIGASIVTLIPRVLPIMVLSRKSLPEWLMRWLSYIPVAVMAALVAQELLISDGKLLSLSNNVELWAALPTFLTAIITKSLLGTVGVGIITVMVLRFLV